MFIEITQSKKSICAKVPTNKFPIKSVTGDLIYPDNHVSKFNYVNIDLFVSSIDISDTEATLVLINPHNRVKTLLESLTGSITLTYTDLSVKSVIKLKLNSATYQYRYSRINQLLIVKFTKFKHTRKEGDYAIM